MRLFILTLVLGVFVGSVQAAPLYTITDLGTLGGGVIEARDINNIGQVVGWAQRNDGGISAYVWDSSTGMQDLGTLGQNTSESLPNEPPNRFLKVASN